MPRRSLLWPVRNVAHLILGFAVVLAVLLPVSAASAQVQQGATLTVLRGQVAIIRSNGTALQPAPSGSTVDVGDEIRTISKAGALITFFSGTEIEMSDDTVLVVDQLSRTGDKIDVSLKQVLGATVNRVQTVAGSGSTYQIQAGGAVALVRGTTFAMIGPVTTSAGNVVIVACLADCTPASTFAGCAMQPYMGYGVVVGRGKLESGCMPFAVARGENMLSAAFGAVTTVEQQVQGDTRGAPAGQVAAGQKQESESKSRQEERKEKEDDKCPTGQVETPGGIWESLALTGSSAAPGQLASLLSPIVFLALGRSRRGLKATSRAWRRARGPMTAVALALVLALAETSVGRAAVPPGGCGPIDVAFVVDDTGSMGDTLDNIKSEFSNVISTIQSASGNDYRLALVTFDDQVQVLEVFSANNQASITPKINALSDGGGGNEPEASDEAMNTVVNALSTSGRPQQNVNFSPAFRASALKIAVLVTDALPAGFDDDFDAGVDDVRAQTVANQAASQGIRISAVYVPIGGVDSTERAIMQSYASTTGGIFVQTPGSGVGAGVALTNIISACGGTTPPPSGSPTPTGDRRC